MQESSIEIAFAERFVAIALIGEVVIAGVCFLPYGTRVSLGGLPLHPLIVHGAVVLLPLLSASTIGFGVSFITSA
ncbi:MAG: hypothetical protein FJ256_02115 [Phycisphaerae bacterium]|nr:hypothetical protein [Actinomycetota bacterium]MBM4101043.1 hypothetical protein [Phycisphaerae bacterium]